MDNYIEQINNLQKQTEEKKIEQAKLQERLKSLTEERDKVLNDLKIYEVSENKLDEEIKKLEESIHNELIKCQEMLK